MTHCSSKLCFWKSITFLQLHLNVSTHPAGKAIACCLGLPAKGGLWSSAGSGHLPPSCFSSCCLSLSLDMRHKRKLHFSRLFTLLWAVFLTEQSISVQTVSSIGSRRGREGVLRFSFSSYNGKPCSNEKVKTTCSLDQSVKYWESSKISTSPHSWRTLPTQLLSPVWTCGALFSA